MNQFMNIALVVERHRITKSLSHNIQGKRGKKINMARFGISDILNMKSKAAAEGGVNEYAEIWLSPYDVKPSENNFYSQEKIEELADSFLTVGQQQPTVLGRVEGEYRIVSGHRRNLANIMNIERGHEKFQSVRYLYKDMTPAMFDLSLIMGNAYNRELTAWEKTQQAQKLKEALIRAKKEDGLEFPGRLRDTIAELMNESPTNIARMDSISHNAAPEIKEEFANGNIGITAAYEASKLPQEKQKEIAEKAKAGEDIRAKEIAARVSEKMAEKAEEDKEKARKKYEKQKEETEREIAEARYKEKEAEEKAAEAELASRDAKVLQRWVRENMAAEKEDDNVPLDVSEMDTPKEWWGKAEWAAFFAGEIMRMADKVKEDDLYLLQEIVIRCQKGETKDEEEGIPGQMDMSDYGI